MFEQTLFYFQSFWFKVRRLSPCSISNIRFDLEIPMADSVQVGHAEYSFWKYASQNILYTKTRENHLYLLSQKFIRD